MLRDKFRYTEKYFVTVRKNVIENRNLGSVLQEQIQWRFRIPKGTLRELFAASRVDLEIYTFV